MELLRSLSPDDWGKKTVAGTWTIKDVTTHLLDGSLRSISFYRDHWSLPPAAVSDYPSLVNHLNQLNVEWVTATRRLSPGLLIEWLDATNEPFVRCLEQLDPGAPARFSVAWAGESVSTNAFHVAREYTEKWHHQQQIREAVGQQGILTEKFYKPALQTFLMALPHTYRDAAAEEGAKILVRITGVAGGEWCVTKAATGWSLTGTITSPEVVISIPAELAWKLFTKAVTPEEARAHVDITGSEALAWPALRMLSVMA